MARLLIEALRRAGHDVDLASRLRSRDGAGDPVRQARLAGLGDRLAHRLIDLYRRDARPRPDLWLTYHLYYKAPDLIGPVVAEALDIPYVVAEASFAPKRAGGKWDIGHRAVAAALARADLVIGLNSRDRICVEPAMRVGARYLTLRPFVDLAAFPSVERAAARATLAERHGLPVDAAWLLAVGMMRPGDKQASYAVLARALEALRTHRPWRLIVVGDGPAAETIRSEFESVADPVTFLGALDADALASVYGAADLLVWPAINEAYGMALLEAHASGVPVLAGASGGVGDIVRSGETGWLVAPGDPAAFAGALAKALADPGRLGEFGARARDIVTRDHGIEGAAASLDRALRSLVEGKS